MRTRRPLFVLMILTLTLVFASNAAAQSENVNLIANVDTHPGYSDVWGYSAPNGTELAIIGASNGTAFIDVTNPAAPNEVLFIPGSSSIWRDMKTYDTYAYIVDDQAGEGLIVVDLSVPTAPVVVRSRFNEFSTAHNIFIDEDAGLAFCCGGSSGSPYTWIYDLTADPSNPQPIYNFDQFYCHDLFTQDGIAYLGAVYNGVLATADISNLPTSMPVLDSIVTDNAFTHNVWVNEANTIAVTTDETSGGHLTIVDVTDPSNIFKVGEYNHPDSPSAIVHNVCVEGDLAYVSWYRNGLEVVDISVPSSPERVGYYDTFPGSGNGFDGAWGVYPYADNGYVYVSDMQTGLYVLEFLAEFGTVEGILTDATSGNPVGGATISIDGAQRTSNGAGFYKFNLAPGAYTVDVAAFGYEPANFGVDITLGETVSGDRALDRVPSAGLTGTVLDNDSASAIPGATVEVAGTPYVTTTDGSGGYSFEFIPVGDYDVTATAFGFGSATESVSIANGVPATRGFVLAPSFFVDDFESNGGWTTEVNGSTGEWTRGNPNGSGGGQVQTEDDHTSAPGTDCFFTGQASPGDGVGSNDVDDGTQVLFSPILDLSELEEPTIRYWRWYVNDGNSNVDDVFTIDISSNGGVDWINVETLTTSRAFWEKADIIVDDFVTTTDQIQFRFIAADEGDGSIVEAAIDDVEIFGLQETTSTPVPVSASTRLMGATPSPFSASLGGEIRFQLAEAQEVELGIVDVQGRRVATLVNGMMAAGSHSISWDGNDARGSRIPVGVYFQTLIGRDLGLTKKLVVLP